MPQVTITEIPIPLRIFAKRFEITGETVWKWKRKGRLNRFTGERVFCELTRLHSGNWGITETQYREFLEKLNERL